MSSSGICQGKVEIVRNSCNKKQVFKLKPNGTKQNLQVYIFKHNLLSLCLVLDSNTTTY